MRLVDLKTAKEDLRLDEDYADDVVVSKIEQASAIIVDYCKVDASLWDPDDTSAVPVPGEVEAACLLIVRALFDQNDAPLSQNVRDLLHRHRDPAFC